MSAATWRDELKHRCPTVLVTGWSTPALPTDNSVTAGGSVEYVCHVAGSVRKVVSRELIERGLKVSNWGGLVAPQVAEHALLLILALLRNLPAWPGIVRSPKQWLDQKASLKTRSLHGRGLGIYGFGAIARELIRIVQPFSPQIRLYAPGVEATTIKAHGVTPIGSLAELAACSDIFVSCEALNPQTRGSINERVLQAMPEGGLFINVGRGALVDETALPAAVRSRRLRYGSDVFAREPLAADSPVHEIPGALLSPHIAGPTDDFYPICGQHALNNVARYMSGLAPDGEFITTEIYDRST